MAGNVAVFKSLPYDPVGDFTPVARLNMGAMGVAVPSSSPYRDIASLIAATKDAGSKLNFGGGSTSYQITTEYFLQQVSGKATYIPYKGVAPALVDLAGSQLDFVIGDYSAVIPHLQSGKLRLLATTGSRRLPTEPNVPTLIESGVKDFNFVNWTAVFAPARTPDKVVRALSESLLRIAATPAAAQLAKQTSTDLFPGDPKQLGEFQRSEIERWSNAAKQAKIEKQ